MVEGRRLLLTGSITFYQEGNEEERIAHRRLGGRGAEGRGTLRSRSLDHGILHCLIAEKPKGGEAGRGKSPHRKSTCACQPLANDQGDKREGRSVKSRPQNPDSQFEFA